MFYYCYYYYFLNRYNVTYKQRIMFADRKRNTPLLNSDLNVVVRL